MKRSGLDTLAVLRIIAGKGEAGAGVTGLIAAAYPSAPPKVILAKLGQMTRQGLIEYGVSVTRPWLTEKGRQALGEDGQ